MRVATAHLLGCRISVGIVGLLSVLMSGCGAGSPPPSQTPAIKEAAPTSPARGSPPPMRDRTAATPHAEEPSVGASSGPSVDDILKNLDFGNIAFNVPGSIDLNDSADIELLLALSTPIETLQKQLQDAGDKQGAHIQVSDRMEAHLSGANFTISPVTSEDQAVTRSGTTRWEWEIKPSSEGEQQLHLTLSALIQVDGQSTPRSIRTFDKEIRVYVSGSQKFVSFFQNNWQWLWATLFVPLAAWFWKRRKQSKPAAGPP